MKLSPGAHVIVIELIDDVAWPVRTRYGVPAVVVIEPLFQSCAITACVSVAGSAFAQFCRLVKSMPDNHRNTAAPPLLMADPVPVGAAVDDPGDVH